MRSYCLHCRCAHGAHEEHEDAFTVAAGTPHVGGLWDCPLVYSTSIAPSQRVTAQAAKCRVSEYMQMRTWCAQRASMKTLSQLLLVHLMSWWSLGLSFGLQHLHSTCSQRVTAHASKSRVSEYMQVRTWCAQRASMKTLSQLLLVHLMLLVSGIVLWSAAPP